MRYPNYFFMVKENSKEALERHIWICIISAIWMVLQHSGIAWAASKFFGLKGDILKSRKYRLVCIKIKYVQK